MTERRYEHAAGVALGDVVRLVSTKFDGTPHRAYNAIKLASDDVGTWLAVPVGGVQVFGPRRLTWTADYPSVRLVPHEGWWLGFFSPPPRRTEVYCDIILPAVWTDGEVRVVDLDLDVVRRRTGEVELLDEDEFAEHRVAYGYPDEIITNAEATAAWLFAALSDGVEPFAGRYQQWIEKAGRLPPV